MKILIVHNNYGKYSGEEAVVDKMASMLLEHGHEVCFYRKTTEGSRESFSGKIKGFFSGIYSPSGVREMRDVLLREKPDVVNIHNLYPFISPAALFECSKANVPVVMTVHNFRLICPTGLFMRNGKPCEVCLNKGTEWSCIQYNCENSLLKSTGYTFRNAYARLTGAYKKNVNRFVCITDFQKQKLITAGFDKEKICVIPNSTKASDRSIYPEGRYVAYIGRLSYEKGYDLLIEVARRNPDIPFCFAGAEREQTNQIIPDNVIFRGYLEKDELNKFIKDSRFLVIPSRCYEGFPMAILEAASLNKPSIAPAHGGFPEIIGVGDDSIGELFHPDDLDDLEHKILNMWNNQDNTKLLGNNAYEKLCKDYSSKVIYMKWEKLFNEVASRS